MHSTRKVKDDLIYVGGSDRRLSRFENLFPIPKGVSYNSYVLLDEKTVLFDTADESISRQYIENVVHALNGRPLDYMVVQHMEPDHCAMIDDMLRRYPEAKMVCSAKAVGMFAQFYGTDVAARALVVKEGDKLSTGEHTLHFVMAPMVHWPEVMVSYESAEKVLFSADAFGKFGALCTDEPWTDEARRYFLNIVGKYGTPVQTLLKKAAKLDIQTICPLHGPVLTGDLAPYLHLYQTWSSYTPEEKGVLVAHASIHGNTAKAAAYLAEQLKALGEKVTVIDLCRCDMAEAVAQAFRYDRMVLAASSYDGGVFLPMEEFLLHLQYKAFQNRTVALVENGSWAPCAAKNMRAVLDTMKQITVLEPTVTIRSAVKPEDEEHLRALAEVVRQEA